MPQRAQSGHVSGVAAAVLTGNKRAFAAGADIKAMQEMTYMDAYRLDFITDSWNRLASFRKPVIAPLRDYVLGGGCEFAVICYFSITADTAKFSQPEITIGTLRRSGGTQQLARYIGNSKAMNMILTGRMMDAQEAERCGLVSRLVPAADLVSEAVKVATQISKRSAPVNMMAKESVHRAFEGALSEGLRFEKRLFQCTFASDRTCSRRNPSRMLSRRRTPLP